jgi:predicted AlkP superfamily pyrophosphatase or phosphodiesterase
MHFPSCLTCLMKFTLFLLLLALGAAAQPDTVQRIDFSRRNLPAQQARPYVILISIDGFRHDYVAKHGAVHLGALAAGGVQARYLVPSFPSLTFPNHYTLVTGLRPSHHGLVDNRFYEPARGSGYSMSNRATVGEGSWYGGTPLWVLAERQGMLSASYFWVGSEAPIQGIRPTYFYNYNEAVGIKDRIATVRSWLQLPEDRRPHLITFYFSEVDHAGHDYGPDAPETGAVVRWVDTAIHRLTEEVAKTGLPVNFIVVADHGMTAVDRDRAILTPRVDSSVAVVVSGGELVQVYLKKRDSLEAVYNRLKEGAEGYTVYRKAEVPKHLRFGEEDDYYNRIGDLVLIPNWPRSFTSSGRRPKPGAHGFDPALVPDMRAIFFAWGPQIRKGRTIGPLSNVEVYPLVTRLLGLHNPLPIDGRGRAVKKILK